MAENTLFLGLDVHKKTVSVATVDSSARAEVRFYGTIANTPDAIRVLCKKLSKDGRQIHACYEAGPCVSRDSSDGPAPGGTLLPPTQAQRESTSALRCT